MSCQVFSGSKGCDLYQEAKAVKYAADNGAVILQCSWGYNSGLSNPISGYTPGFTSDKDWVDAAPLEKEAFDYFLHNAGSPNDVIAEVSLYLPQVMNMQLWPDIRELILIIYL